MSLRRSFYNKNIDQVETHNMFDPEDKTQKHRKPKWKVIIACIFTVIISCSICSYLFYQNGYQSGNAQGYNTGFEAGKSEGYLTGKKDGNAEGFQQGYEKGKQYGNGPIHSLAERYNKNTEELCSVNGCSYSKKIGSEYCFYHGCIKSDCYNRRANNLTMYCKDHKCAIPDCNSGAAINSQYCISHQ